MNNRAHILRNLSSTIRASTLFQSNIIYETAKIQSGNDFVISPIALRSMLTIIALAAIKDSHRELLTVMGLKNTQQGILEYKACRNTSKDDFVFTVHNALFVNTRLELSLSFQGICMENFQTRVMNIEFQNREESATRINNWIAEQTEGHIKANITAEEIAPDQDTLLINMARFESRWRKSFPKKMMTRENFWITAKEKDEVYMMHDYCEMPIGQLDDLKATAVLVPYKNININLLILLPNDIDGLTQLEEDLQQQRVDLTSLVMTFKMQNIKLGLPRLHLETDMDMKPVLKELGINQIFTDSMGFARLLAVAGLMKITQLRHIAAMSVNDGGTNETSSKVSFLLTESENYTAININHPFLFAVMDGDRIFYGGHITNTAHFLK